MCYTESNAKEEKDLPRAISHINGKEYADYNCPDTVDWARYRRELRAAMESDCQVVIMERLLTLWILRRRRSWI